MQILFLLFVLCLSESFAFKLQPLGPKAEVSSNDQPALAEKLAIYSALMHDLREKIHEQETGQQVRRSMAKERRAPLDTFDEWEGMMESLDNLRKPRFG